MDDHSFFPNNHEQVQNVKDPLLLMSLGQDGHPTFIGYIGGHVRQRSHYLIAVEGGIPEHFVFDFDYEGEGDGSLWLGALGATHLF